MDFKNMYKNFDLLRFPISLSYKNKYLYRTFIGATLTILCFIIVIAYFIFKLTQIIKKSSFSILSNEFQDPKDIINFTNTPILFALTDNNGNPMELNSKIVDFSVVMSEYSPNFDNKGNSHIIYLEKEIEIERCDKLNNSIDFSYFAEYNISDFKCIKPSQNLTINGTYGDIINGYKSLKIYIKKCNNLIENCYNSDYIESIISNSKFVIIYLGYKTNFYSKNNKDIEKTIYSRSISLSSSFCKRVYYYLTIVKYKLYDDILLNKKREQIYFINRDMYVEFNPIQNNYLKDSNNNKDIFAFFSFVYDGNVIEYTKKVQKIGEVVSYVGNLFNIILTIFKIINNYFSNKILFIDIFYRFFFEEKFKKKDSKNIHFDNSNLFFLPKKELSSIKINIKTQDKSNSSNFNSILNDKSIDNQNNNSNNLNSSNLGNKVPIKKVLSVKSKHIEKEKDSFIKHSKLYYLCPFFVIKNKKNLNHLITIKNSICSTFSLEHFNEFFKIIKSINIIKKEKLHNYVYENRNHLSDKNVRSEINKILNFK